jgi:hypothetical protein
VRGGGVVAPAGTVRKAASVTVTSNAVRTATVTATATTLEATKVAARTREMIAAVATRAARADLERAGIARGDDGLNPPFRRQG